MLFDLHPAFAAKSDMMPSRFRYDSHWSATGHEWAAAALIEYFKRNPGLLSPP